MSQISNIVDVVADLLRGDGGLQTNIDALSAAELLPSIKLTDQQLVTQNLPVDIADRSTAAKYPCVYVYCDKAVNQLREKFRTFSGTVSMVAEIRASTDRVEQLDAQASLLVDAVTTTLDQNRGDWGAGVFYGGKYEIGFAGIKQGGKNFIQMIKVTFDLDVSRN